MHIDQNNNSERKKKKDKKAADQSLNAILRQIEGFGATPCKSQKLAHGSYKQIQNENNEGSDSDGELFSTIP